MDIKKVLSGLGPYDQSKLEKTRSDKLKSQRESDAGSSSARGDKVSISDEAQLRTEAYSTASSASDIRHDKVAEIKARIEAGEYEINTRKIAENIVKEDLDFFS
ncbi:flagellar biosynthesis anti-sigma factor FlgM [Oceanidesulfovibrio marinus]|uniref:Negative regulator of flagellin synthesis n=1 Tax=Oceanidesulfovibrio marinus TaxID=370038 RepID=A0A6P1ZHQ3_9BACT|nr:flagellar biosynthesis anti-sigma factor FlgM [Oceanidesulfovibrio marinus]TVM34152.1 flagellar biosynthesis anti-sigma factor FlgM [Oceanidesulfovibrio marinus]